MIIARVRPARRQSVLKVFTVLTVFLMETVSIVATVFIVATAAVLSIAPSTAQAQVAQAEPEYTGDDRIEKWKGKTVLVVTPHPDDETFTSGGLLSMLVTNGNIDGESGLGFPL